MQFRLQRPETPVRYPFAPLDLYSLALLILAMVAIIWFLQGLLNA